MAAPAEPTLHWSKKPLTLRLISAAVLIPIVVAAVYAGHPAWDLLVILFAGVMAWEWISTATSTRSRWWSIAPAFLVAVNLGIFAFRHELFTNSLISIFIVLFLGLFIPFCRRASLWLGIGLAYIFFPCAAIIALRSDPSVGLQQILWIVALVIAADTGAYAAGRSIGGPKLAPRISPNKTWAGLGGAVVSAAIVGAITATVLDRPSFGTLTAVSAGLGIVAQMGDLAESAFKRHFGVKDASNIIPGHGGALDRVDGLIAVAAAVAGINAWIGSSVLTWL
jgi:phosphatidate cytidylyltransferase